MCCECSLTGSMPSPSSMQWLTDVAAAPLGGHVVQSVHAHNQGLEVAVQGRLGC